ncbi:Uma2 family endonuclease [Streptomyces sp. APSN-46.1]|uniref:Uma2 family endonuclease n=1 Tax=Streptomyces sp. APSN-46.1 TaxID=2929049 RepID=UPI001FB3A921|nr:Uma2 family endonuclease [Streptomyces sp. APSN-46.1]MCJ1678367.1 Uma2 family endonuclease [Streptomyces sp. APSN-46.1]
MSTEEFEELARNAPRLVRLEFIRGRVQVKPVPDGNHQTIVMWLLKQCMRQRPDLELYGEQGLKVEAYRNGRARADAVLVPEEHLVGRGDWIDPTGVLMAVEVTSHDRDTDARDRLEKPEGYAQAGIPVYLLIDRENLSVVVHAEPEGGKYRAITARPFGAVIDLPEPVKVTLETERLKEYADWA